MLNFHKHNLGLLLMVLSIMMTKKLLKNLPISRLECKNHTLLMTKMAKIDTLFMTKTAEKLSLWGCRNLYSPYKGEPPSNWARNIGFALPSQTKPIPRPGFYKVVPLKNSLFSALASYQASMFRRGQSFQVMWSGAKSVLGYITEIS